MLEQLADDLFTAELPLRMSLFEVGTRTTIVRLPDSGLWMHSPGPIDSKLRAEIDALGPVRFLVAPNKFHHLHLAAAAEAFPEAQVFLAPGLAEKVKGLPAGSVLDAAAPQAWAGSIDQLWLKGCPAVQEIAFLHRPSRTLLLTDLCFNVQGGAALSTRVFFSLTGVWKRFGPSRLMRLMIRDKRQLRSALDRVLDWDFDRVLLGHGQVLASDARESLRRAFEFLPG